MVRTLLADLPRAGSDLDRERAVAGLQLQVLALTALRPERAHRHAGNTLPRGADDAAGDAPTRRPVERQLHAQLARPRIDSVLLERDAPARRRLHQQQPSVRTIRHQEPAGLVG